MFVELQPFQQLQILQQQILQKRSQQKLHLQGTKRKSMWIENTMCCTSKKIKYN